MKTFYKIFASGFGSGFSPVAPGTAGSIAACLLFYFFSSIENWFAFYVFHFTTCLLFTIIGIISTTKLESEWGHDSPKFTIDEITGMFFALLFTPFEWTTVLIAFILFRFFDILKPFGIRSLETVHGGWGVMLDDILAGIYTNILLHVILFSMRYF